MNNNRYNRTVDVSSLRQDRSTFTVVREFTTSSLARKIIEGRETQMSLHLGSSGHFPKLPGSAAGNSHI